MIHLIKYARRLRSPDALSVSLLWSRSRLVGIGKKSSNGYTINGLFEDLSSMEARFIEDPEPSRREIINASWYSERLITLLWALGLASMPPADEQCDTSLFQDILPPYAEVSESDFINSAKLRKDDELMAMADQTLDLHWEARDAEIHRRSPRNVNLGIIQERHHAINWVIGYDGLAWDEVTTDT